MLKLKTWIVGSVAVVSLSSLWGLQAVEAVVEPVPQVIEKPVVIQPVPVEEGVVREVPYGTSGSFEEGVIHHGDWHDGHHWDHHDGGHWDRHHDWDHHDGDRHHGDRHDHHHSDHHGHHDHHGHGHHGDGHHK